MSGSLFIVAAPSGAGKSTLVNALLAEDRGLSVSVSHTTRAPRAGEQDGRHYHFVSRERFLEMQGDGAFLEFAEVHGNLYGTSKAAVAAPMAAGRDVIFEIDCQGAAQLRAVFAGAVSIFILPPSLAELERRLRARGTETDEVVRRRLAAARQEMRNAVQFDYVIINSDFSEALKRMQAVVIASRQRLAQVASTEGALFAELGIRLP
ncbi:MAG: guanylate kinase [Burkholderiales bacterium]|nr:guanylate kinase [Burkholderiales bacterium]